MSIPTLDLQLAESDRSEAARQLLAALEEPGFIYLKNVKGYEPGTYKLLQNLCPSYHSELHAQFAIIWVLIHCINLPVPLML